MASNILAIEQEISPVHRIPFSEYIAKQIGFDTPNQCPKLISLAYNHLKSDKDIDWKVYNYFTSQTNPEQLSIKLLEELDRCMLGYFSFQWNDGDYIISQIMTENKKQSKLKEAYIEVTRDWRFERVQKNLRVQRLFCTLIDEIKLLKGTHLKTSAPTDDTERSPTLLLMGGGAGSGKSTVLQLILKEEANWSKSAAKVVVVEADAFKERDVVYKTLHSTGYPEDKPSISKFVHNHSLAAAASVLVTALNDGSDVILDGTLSWAPFAVQTILMARNIHRQRYRIGPGYKIHQDGTVSENYWEKVDAEEQEDKKMPYQIELVGVFCDPHLAIVRSFRRAIKTGRAVNTRSQIRSLKSFAENFDSYCELVDTAKLYSTDTTGFAQLIGTKIKGEKFAILENMNEFNSLKTINQEAGSVFQLYPDEPEQILKEGKILNDKILLQNRNIIQKEIYESVKRIEDPQAK